MNKLEFRAYIYYYIYCSILSIGILHVTVPKHAGSIREREKKKYDIIVETR
jgi:hypothetical protein